MLLNGLEGTGLKMMHVVLMHDDDDDACSILFISLTKYYLY